MHYHFMEDLLTLRRSTATNLRNSDGSEISLAGMMPTHTTHTVELEVIETENIEFQWLHRFAAR